MTGFFKVNPSDGRRIVYIKGNQDMLSRHIRKPKDGDSDGPTFDVWDSGVDLHITPTIPQTTTKPPPPAAPSGPSHATGPTGTAVYSLETRPGTLGGPHWMDQTPFSTIDPATQHQQPRTIGRQKGWQTESTLFNATVPTLNKRPHLVAHPGPPPMYNDGSSRHPITPTPSVPHSALGVPPYAQVAPHRPMAPHIAPAPVRSSVSSGHQNPTRRPPTHARFQTYTRAPPQSSRKRSSSQPYADILQRDWGYTSIYPERATELRSPHPWPWGPLTAEAHVQYGGLTAYRASGWDAYLGLIMNVPGNIPPHPQLHARPAFSTAASHPRPGAFGEHAQIPDRRGLQWGSDALFPHESLLDHQSTFSEQRHPDVYPLGDREVPRLPVTDAQRHAVGTAGTSATAPMSLDYEQDGSLPLPDPTSYNPDWVRRGQTASRQRVRGDAILTTLPEGGNRANDDQGRAYAISATGAYNCAVREEIPPETTHQGITVSPQLRAVSPLFARDVARQSSRTPLINPYSQGTPWTGTRAEDVNYHIAALAPSAYAQTSGVDHVAHVNEFPHAQDLANTAAIQPQYHDQGYSPSLRMVSSRPSRSLPSATTSSVAEARHQQLVANAAHPVRSSTSTYSALQDAVSLPVKVIKPIPRRHSPTSEFR